MRYLSTYRRIALAAVFLAVLGTGARAELIIGVTDAVTPSLVSFDSATPNLLTTIAPISGLVAGHTLRGIDFRPSDGQLYAISSSGTTSAAQLYTVNLTTGLLTNVGSGLTLTGNTSARISLDFNPVVDALRVVTGTAQNYRVNPNTEALIAQDANVNPANLIAGIAYTNNVVGASSTTLFAYNFTTDTIGTIGSVGGTPSSPNGGSYTAVGASGFVAVSAALGFDISGATGTAYVSLDSQATSDNETEFFTVNLSTGVLSFVGDFPSIILDISVRPVQAAAPEPGSLGLLGMGLMSCVAAVAHRRRKA